MTVGLFRRNCLVVACAVLASCGGGGGGGSSGGGGDDAIPDEAGSSRLTFAPSSIQIIQTQGVEETINVVATLTPVPEDTNFIAVVAADKPVVQTGEVFLDVRDDNSAAVTLTTERALAAGTHKGELTVHLCLDPQCKNEIGLTGNVLPYSIKVLPQVQVVASGVVRTESGGPDEYLVDPGASFVLRSNIPVTWSKGSSVTGTSLEVIASTPTRWEGRILGRSGNYIGVSAASVEKPETNSTQALFYLR